MVKKLFPIVFLTIVFEGGSVGLALRLLLITSKAVVGIIVEGVAASAAFSFAFTAHCVAIMALSFASAAFFACRAGISTCTAVGVVTAHATASVGSTVERVHYLLGILFGHLDVSKLAQQVDVSHLLASVNVAVDKLHHLARIEAVVLAQVDEQALKASLGLARSALSGGGAALASSLGVARCAVVGGLQYLGCVGIIF